MDGMAGWDEPRIRRAMNEDQPATVRLERPLPVLIAYGTTVVKSGRVHFYEDIYGDDRRLDAALKQRRAPLAAD
jgi:murein L,D-transpeptidase YcbB/YkuD